jgi:hypothetical protein
VFQETAPAEIKQQKLAEYQEEMTAFVFDDLRGYHLRLCCTFSDSRVMDETYPIVDLLCKPTDRCPFRHGQQRFTENATEPQVI